MDEQFKLVDADDAQAFLRQFSADARRRGHGLFHQGAVTELQAFEAGNSYGARVVEGPSHYEVRLLRNEDNWTATCTCPLDEDCAHYLP